jgi:hypothetical protein
MVRSLGLVGVVCVLAPLAFGQGANGTITGTITDPTGSVIPGASVEATNVDTGAAYTAASTSTGNFTVPNLPVGTYTLSVKAAGFKAYTHPNLAIAATQILREDVHLEVGAATESVTVEAEATLLKTESGDNSTNITLEQLQDLPLLGIGTVNSGTSGVRNPYNSLLALPGVTGYSAGNPFVINGLGGGFVLSETMRIEGQDATSRMFNAYTYTQMAQPNADAIQEVAYQTSNYAAEFGQAGSAVINMTMKSGTNQYHGTAFDYFVNEDLNSGQPFSVNANGSGKVRLRNRRNDFGGTLGGPVRIPKIYNGKDKTFFFFAYEQYLEGSQYSFTDTVPTADYLTGNFSHISPNGDCSLCALYGIPTGPLGGVNAQGQPLYTDALGRPTYANEIYDPTTRAINPANGRAYANPFPNNIIPASRLNPTTLAIQKLFPAPQNANLIGNYLGSVPGNRYTAIPSIKADQIISSADKLSFYWSRINTESQVSVPYGAADGLPLEIGQYRGTFIPTWTTRLNYDRTLTPTLLFHAGAGYYHTSFSDHAPFLNFDPSQFGLSGFLIHRNFPVITGMCPAPSLFGASAGCGGYGGMQQLGPGAGQTQSYEEKPSFNATATWVKGNHTIKGGGEMYLEQNYTGTISLVRLATGTGPTSLPENPTVGFSGFTEGFGYASFLLGDFTSTTQGPNEIYRVGNQTWGLFLQDTWKVTRRLTLDYGLRWDLNTPYHEQYGRLGQLDPNTPNANAGGRLGSTRYASTCNCPFYQPTYPYAIGPRLGVAYQITPKTVFRGGFGINYQYVGANAGATIGTNGVYPLSGINPFVNISTPGAIVQPTWPVTNPFIYPVPGTAGVAGQAPTVPDANQNRPPRITQWSVGFQRELSPNLLVEASYVANRAVWLQGVGGTTSIGGPLGFLSQISPAVFAKYGLYPFPGTGPGGYNYTIPGVNCVPGNDCDRVLLTLPLSNPAVQQKLASAGMPNFLPYAGFPTNNTLLSALYPYPQFGNIGMSGSPTGDSKYDSLQIKVTKRLSHGLQVNGNFTWAQGFARPIPQNFFDPASARWELQQIPPVNLNFNAVYTVPKFAALPKVAGVLVKDWQVGWFSNYQSGAFLAPPISPTADYLPSEEIRVPGAPLYTKGVNLNDLKTYNPYYTQVLNPNAWEPCPVNAACAAAAPGAFGPTATVYYKDFRAPRTPSENANIGRNFRFGKEGQFNLYIRAEFVNIFNRTIMPAPATNVSPQVPLSRNSLGILTGGFGVISAYFTPGSANASTNSPFLQGRTGTLIARFSF